MTAVPFIQICGSALQPVLLEKRRP